MLKLVEKLADDLRSCSLEVRAHLVVFLKPGSFATSFPFLHQCDDVGSNHGPILFWAIHASFCSSHPSSVSGCLPLHCVGFLLSLPRGNSRISARWRFACAPWHSVWPYRLLPSGSSGRVRRAREAATYRDHPWDLDLFQFFQGFLVGKQLHDLHLNILGFLKSSGFRYGSIPAGDVCRFVQRDVTESKSWWNQSVLFHFSCLDWQLVNNEADANNATNKFEGFHDSVYKIYKVLKCGGHVYLISYFAIRYFATPFCSILCSLTVILSSARHSGLVDVENLFLPYFLPDDQNKIHEPFTISSWFLTIFFNPRISNWKPGKYFSEFKPEGWSSLFYPKLELMILTPSKRFAITRACWISSLPWCNCPSIAGCWNWMEYYGVQRKGSSAMLQSQLQFFLILFICL